MCGIVGFTGTPDDKVLAEMTATLVHRGPDDDGFFTGNGISFGFRRLSIVDVSTGNQPVHNEDRTVWSVMNGEIYNFIELRKELKDKGHTFYTDHSDVETIVHLYEEYGPDFVHRLNGMFAIAIWDEKEKVLLLYRDRLGVKPLFYTRQGERLLFGSEIKALLRHPDVPRRMNREAVGHFFSFKHIPAPYTAFEGIYAVRPGEKITCGQDGCFRKEKYWAPDYRAENEYEGREDDAADELFSLLKDATTIRMRSDVQVGAYLSGGVDSSLVTALMAITSGHENMKTFSFGYADDIPGKSDDVRFAMAVSEKYHTEHHKYTVHVDEVAAGVVNAIRSFDQPFGGVISTYFLSDLIARHVKVALSGDGADELFGSYLSHRLAPALDVWQQGGRVGAPGLELFAGNEDFLQELIGYSDGDPAAWRYRIMPFGKAGKDSIFAEGFDPGNGSENGTRKLLDDYFGSCSSHQPLNRVLEMELKSIFPDQVLAFVDFLSMAHSVEVRSPFVDYRVVEFAARLPSEMKIANGVVKHILKKAVDRHNILPEGITKRPKEGFVMPVYRWMDGPLKPWVYEVLSPRNIQRAGVLSPTAVERILGEHYEGGDNRHGEIWNLVIFQIWWEEYFG